MDKVDAAGDGRGKTDAVVRARHIVVHGFGDGDHRESLPVKPQGK